MGKLSPNHPQTQNPTRILPNLMGKSQYLGYLCTLNHVFIFHIQFTQTKQSKNHHAHGKLRQNKHRKHSIPPEFQKNPLENVERIIQVTKLQSILSSISKLIIFFEHFNKIMNQPFQIYNFGFQFMNIIFHTLIIRLVNSNQHIINRKYFYIF